jgi:hypothetical protein
VLLSTDHLFVWTDIFHAWKLQGYTCYLWEGESVLHKSVGFFYRHRYTPDNKIATHEINLRQQQIFSPTPHEQYTSPLPKETLTNLPGPAGQPAGTARGGEHPLTLPMAVW